MKVHWDQYEVAILLIYAQLVIDGELKRGDAIIRASQTLRQLAENRMWQIDDVFRNTNGISMLISNAIALIKGEECKLACPAIFVSVANIYKSDKKSFNVILKEAYDMYININSDIENYEVVDFKSNQKYAFCTPVRFSIDDKQFMVGSWTDLYVKFLQFIYDNEKHIIINNIGKNIGMMGHRIDFVYEDDLLSLKSPKAVTKKIYVETNYSATDIIRKIKAIIDISTYSYSEIIIEYYNKNDVKKDYSAVTISEPLEIIDDENYMYVNFAADTSYSFTKTHYVSFMGEKHFASTWTDVLVELSKSLYKYNPELFYSYIGKNISFDKGRADIGSEAIIGSMVSPKAIADNLFIETNLSANSIVEKIKRYIDIFNLKYSDVVIAYTNKTITQKPSVNQNKENSDETFVDNELYSQKMLQIAESLLKESFSNGFRLNSVISTKKFKREYKACTGNEWNDCISVDKLMSSVGLIYDEKVFYISEDLLHVVDEIITDIEASGYINVFYDELYRVHSKVLEEYQLYSVEFLCNIVKKLRPDLAVYKDYFSFDRSIGLDQEIAKVYGDDIMLTYAEMKERLPYFVPQESLRGIVSFSKLFIRNSEETYVLYDRVQFDEGDVREYGEMVEHEINDHGYAVISHGNVEKSEMLNYGVSKYAICEALYKKYYSDKYDKNYTLLGRKGTALSVYELMTIFCNEHERLTISQIEEYERSINGHINHGIQAADDNMIRVSKNEFVNKDYISFDVDAVDEIIDSFVSDRIIPIMNINNFLVFPYMEGYTWNSFMLCAFLKHYSKRFRYMGIPRKTKCGGAVMPLSIYFENYDDVLAKVLADSGIELTNENALNYLIEKVYIMRRCDCSEIVQKAADIRFVEGISSV